MIRPPENAVSRSRELALLGLTIAALGVTIAFEHFVIHRQVIIPALESGPVIPPWMWAAMLTPELIVCFGAGWRIRGQTWLVAYACAAALHREAWQYGLALAREPGHLGHYASSPAEFAIAAPLVAVAYYLVFALASASARELPEPSPGNGAGPG